MGVRVEVSTSGIDEALQGLTSDPYGGALPGTTTLRIPSLRQNDTTRYLFLLCSRVVSAPTRIRGIRQLLNLGFTVTTAAKEDTPALVQTLTLPVTSPGFMAPDGNVSWHLVSEPNPNPNIATPAPATLGCREATNFAYRQAYGPALLFNAATFTAQTDYYNVNMTAYTPPPIATLEWQPLGGLGNMHDLRFPWDSADAWKSLDIPFCPYGARRVSLYASVLQTAGLPTPESTPTGTTTPGWPPEYGFAFAAQGINAAAVSDITASSVLFWGVGGAIIFEDYDCGCGGPT